MQANAFALAPGQFPAFRFPQDAEHPAVLAAVVFRLCRQRQAVAEQIKA